VDSSLNANCHSKLLSFINRDVCYENLQIDIKPYNNNKDGYVEANVMNADDWDKIYRYGDERETVFCKYLLLNTPVCAATKDDNHAVHEIFVEKQVGFN